MLFTIKQLKLNWRYFYGQQRDFKNFYCGHNCSVLTVSAIAVFLLMSGNGGNDGTNDNGGGTSVDVAGEAVCSLR